MDMKPVTLAAALAMVAVYFGEDAMDWVKNRWWLVALAAITAIPVMSYLNMRDRKAAEQAANTWPLDDRVKGLTLTVQKDSTFVTYVNGVTQPCDGLGLVAVTLEDHKASPDRLAAYALEESAFPVVVFFNRTGFDASGLPVVIRRAGDGTLLVPKADADRLPGRMRAAHPLPGSGWRLYFWGTKGGDVKDVSDKEWEEVYLGAADAAKGMTPEQLDKLTDEQLKALGISRVPKAELREKSKTGVKGRVVRVGDTKNPVIPLSVHVMAFRGVDRPKEANLAGKTVSTEDGVYAIALPPGKYVIAVKLDGVLYGNALNPEAFPSVTVPEDGWVDYEFRRGR